MSKQKIKDAINSAVESLNQLSTFVETLPENYSPLEALFEHPVTTQSDIDELNDYFHQNIGKSGRSLNHSLNKVNMDWKMKNIRTPRGPRALHEVAVDHKLDVNDLCEAILANPRFENGAIGDAAKEILGR